MSRLHKLLKKLRRRPAGKRVGMRRPTYAAPLHDAAKEDELRTILIADPNNREAFTELAELVWHRTVESAEHEHYEDALSAESSQNREEAAQDAAHNAVWSLAEELAGNPHAWYPLVELARLSVHEDRDGAMRRLTTAAERDDSGKALAEALKMLRDAELPADALALGMGHWRVQDHEPEAGKQLIYAAVEAGRLAEARRHFEALIEHPDTKYVGKIRSELEGLLNE